MDEEGGDVFAEMGVLRLDEEQDFGVDADAIGRRVTVTPPDRLHTDSTPVLQRRRTTGRRVQLRSAEHPTHNNSIQSHAMYSL